MKRAPTKQLPDALSYKFSCNGDILAYTVIVSRGPKDRGNVDFFDPAALIYDPSGNVVNSPSFSCEGPLPGDGVNCNTGGSNPMPASDSAQGTFDTSDPYCASVSSAATGSKHRHRHGKKSGSAQTIPEAFVQVIVSDSSGAEDGPFLLRLNGKCPSKPAAVKKSHKHKNKH